jgi:hypothetical protein
MTCHIDACDCRGVNREGAERWQRSRAEPAGGGRVVMVIVSLFRDGFSAVVLTEDAYAVCFTVVFDVNRIDEPNGNRLHIIYTHTSHDMHRIQGVCLFDQPLLI